MPSLDAYQTSCLSAAKGYESLHNNEADVTRKESHARHEEGGNLASRRAWPPEAFSPDRGQLNSIANKFMRNNETSNRAE